MSSFKNRLVIMSTVVFGIVSAIVCACMIIPTVIIVSIEWLFLGTDHAWYPCLWLMGRFMKILELE